MLTRTKPQEELATRRCMKKTQKEAFRMKGASWNAEQNKNTNNNKLDNKLDRRRPKKKP